MSDSKPVVNEELAAGMLIKENIFDITEDVVNAHLGTYGVNMDEVKKVQDAVNKATNDIVGAAGIAAVDHMAANAEVAAVSGQFKVGKQQTNLTVSRTHEARINQTDPSQGTRTVRGYVKASTNSGIVENARRNVRKEVSAYGELKLK